MNPFEYRHIVFMSMYRLMNALIQELHNEFISVGFNNLQQRILIPISIVLYFYNATVICSFQKTYCIEVSKVCLYENYVESFYYVFWT